LVNTKGNYDRFKLFMVALLIGGAEAWNNYFITRIFKWNIKLFVTS